MIYKNYIRTLHIDMRSGKIHIKERRDLTRYLGGVGVAAKLLEEFMRPDLPPLAPEQPIVFAIGAMSTVYPVITKTVAMFISPLTGELGESYAGGRMAMTLFEAGYDAVVISGRAARPTYLTISNDDVQFRDARTLKGMGTAETGRLIRDYETGHGGKRSILCIGPAGENTASYACVTVDRYRHFGRLGLGAVFGSKQLKAIHIMGGNSIPIENFRDYFKAYREIYAKSTEAGGPMAKYHDTGTPINIEPLSALGALPTLNLRQGIFEHAEQVSGDAFAQKHLVRKMACTGCPVGCIHIGQIRRAFNEVGYEFETMSVGYDYELIFALGTFLGISDPADILGLIEAVEECGLDAMSAGVSLGWATEALLNGLITIDDTIVPLSFGEPENYRRAINYIAEGTNDFYKNLARGVRHASEVYGGGDYAMHVAGNEMPGYHTGYGSLAGAAVAARHSHLCNGGYSIDQSMKYDATIVSAGDTDTGAVNAGAVNTSAETGTVNTSAETGAADANVSLAATANMSVPPLTAVDTGAVADALFAEETERCMLNSLIMCLFARKVYDRGTIIKALAAIGMNMTDDDLTAVARRNLAVKIRIKKALGFDLRDVRLPERFFQTPSMHGVLNKDVTYEILEKYRARLAELESVAEP